MENGTAVNHTMQHVEAVKRDAAAAGYQLVFEAGDHGRWQYRIKGSRNGQAVEHIGGGAEFGTCLLAAELMLHSMRHGRHRV